MIRLTGGHRRGMILSAPPGYQTRPATARVREWIFNVLGSPAGMSVLDLFAGTGAVGLEALSRGADSVLFVEDWKPALVCLEENIRKTGYNHTTEVMKISAAQAAATLKDDCRHFDLCFCDPPYDYRSLDRLLEESVLELVSPDGTLIVEHRGEPPLAPFGWLPDREATFGDTILSLWTNLNTPQEN